MKIPFDSMPDSSRVWVYQADRKLSEQELELVASYLEQFTESWAAHGSPLRASYTLEHQQFVIIAVDESFSSASGCSIDASVGVFRELENQIGVSFLDKSKVAVLHEGAIQQFPISGIKEAVASGEITTDYKVLNNHITSLGELKKSWVQPVDQSWMKRYFN